MNPSCRSQFGASSISIAFLIIAGLLVLVVAWLMIEGQDRSDSGFAVTEQEWMMMHAEVKTLKKEVESLRHGFLAWEDRSPLNLTEPFPAGSNNGPAASEIEETPLSKGNEKVQEVDPYKERFFNLVEDVERLHDSEDVDEKYALVKKLLNSNYAWAQGEAILELLKFDPAAGVKAIYTLLDTALDDPKGQFYAVHAVQSLGKLQGFPVSSDLYRFYESEVEGVSTAAAYALEQQGDSSLIERELNRFAGQLNTPDPRKRRQAIDCMGYTYSSRAVPYLLPLLKDPDPEIRIRALDALGLTIERSQITEIESMLNDPVAAVRDRAVIALENMHNREQSE